MIFSISLVETGLNVILGKEETLKTSNKYPLKVLILTLGLQFFWILLRIESGTDRKYLLKASEILVKLDERLSELFQKGKVSH
jgi:hypothetical protein